MCHRLDIGKAETDEGLAVTLSAAHPSVEAPSAVAVAVDVAEVIREEAELPAPSPVGRSFHPPSPLYFLSFSGGFGVGGDTIASLGSVCLCCRPREHRSVLRVSGGGGATLHERAQGLVSVHVAFLSLALSFGSPLRAVRPAIRVRHAPCKRFTSGRGEVLPLRNDAWTPPPSPAQRWRVVSRVCPGFHSPRGVLSRLVRLPCR